MPNQVLETLANQELQERDKLESAAAEMRAYAQAAEREMVSHLGAFSRSERMKQRAQAVAARTRGRASVVINRAQRRLALAKARVNQAIRTARRRSRHLASEHPAEVIATVAGAAFVTGILLRFWRSSHHA